MHLLDWKFGYYNACLKEHVYKTTCVYVLYRPIHMHSQSHISIYINMRECVIQTINWLDAQILR